MAKGRTIGGRAGLVLAAAAFAVLFFIGKSIFDKVSSQQGEVTVQQMRDFLGDYGWVASSEPDFKEIVIPAEFSEVYEQYNQLQKEQGYDLSKYRTETVKQYTFKILNYCTENGTALSNVEAHILVRGGEIIGGDLCSTDMSGFMTGFSG